MDTAIAQRPQRKVLVVEDNELNRKLLEVRLEIYGYEALTTGKGAAALDIARSSNRI
jgi:CheY-like chemotaxis protein